MPASDCFEIESDKFQTFHSNLISFSKNYAHRYLNGEAISFKFDQQERKMILEKTDRFNKAKVTTLTIAENQIADLRSVLDRASHFMELLNKIEVLQIRTLNMFKEQLDSSTGFEAMESAEGAKELLISLYHSLSAMFLVKVPYRYVIKDFPV